MYIDDLKPLHCRCMKNCEYFSSPLEEIYLFVESNCRSCSFEWNYKEKSNSADSSTESIREPDTPDYVFIVKKRSLDYGKVYVFHVKGS